MARDKKTDIETKDWRSTHGMSYSNIYQRYWRIKERCGNENNKRFSSYGGRGIKCEWKTFEDFYKDMDEGFKNGLTIERIDVDGNYCKENCRWATNLEQQNNKTNNHKITFEGVTKSIGEWAREKGIKYNTLSSRIYRGMDIQKALNP